MDYNEMDVTGNSRHWPCCSHFAASQGKKCASPTGTDPQIGVAASPLGHLLQTCQLLSICPVPPWTQHLLDSSRIPQEAPGRTSKPFII